MHRFSVLAVFVSLLYFAQSAKVKVDVTHKVTLDIARGGQPLGQIVIGLFGKLAPRTVQNFATFASRGGFKGLNYVGSKFHRIIDGYIIQGGDILNGDGTGSISIYGDQFADEKFTLKHTEPYMLSMANAGKDSNGSQFFITLRALRSLDGKHVIFGKVISGRDVVDAISGSELSGEKPVQDITVTKVDTVPIRGKFNIEQ
ncbi:Peptidyl-prolyl cis-trans isomerase B [Halotydeus destructor]|nr:Peptidyl-prolyl cis-trans isomerase B [Halotydeus destructor]